MHWAAKYIGIPYEAAARGPDKVDCWGLVRLIYLNEFHIELPLYPGLCHKKPVEAAIAIKQGLETDWKPCRAFDGCLVAMSQREEIHHIGVYTFANNCRVLHCWHEQAVVADTIANLRLKGMRTIKYYQHRQWLTS